MRELYLARRTLEIGGVHVGQHGHVDLVRIRHNCPALRERLHNVSHTRLPLLNDRVHSDERRHFCVQSVTHELEDAVRRDERDDSIIFKPRKMDALVELDVLPFHRFVLWLAARARRNKLNLHLVAEPEFEVGHSGDITLHDHLADNFRPQQRRYRRPGC